MSKKFKGKICAYCSNAGDTADHIFAKQIFPADQRANLPQVCACQPCNNRKSQLEHYLLAVLPFGGRHTRSQEILTTMVPPRLEKNRALRSILADGRREITVAEDGINRRSVAVPFDGGKLDSYLGMVARGLVAYHWGAIVPHSFFSGGSLLTDYGDDFYKSVLVEMCRLGGRPPAQGNIGNDLLLYEGVQDAKCSGTALWRFQIYGGAVLGEDSRQSETMSSTLWALTARQPSEGFEWPPSPERPDVR